MKSNLIKTKTKKELTARKKLFAKQIREWGFSDECTWSLDSFLAELFIPILKKANADKKIIKAFELAKTGDWNWGNKISIGANGWQERYNKAMRKMDLQVKEGFKLFAKDFFKLPPKTQKEILHITVPRLRRFRELTGGWPSCDELPTFESWTDILDDMIHGFTNWWISIDAIKIENKKEVKQLMVKSLELFSKWYQDLWW